MTTTTTTTTHISIHNERKQKLVANFPRTSHTAWITMCREKENPMRIDTGFLSGPLFGYVMTGDRFWIPPLSTHKAIDEPKNKKKTVKAHTYHDMIIEPQANVDFSFVVTKHFLFCSRFVALPNR